jgi:hypothetical protein
MNYDEQEIKIKADVIISANSVVFLVGAFFFIVCYNCVFDSWKYRY